MTEMSEIVEMDHIGTERKCNNDTAKVICQMLKWPFHGLTCSW